LDAQYDTAQWEWRKFNAVEGTYSAVPGVRFGTAVVDGATVTTASFALVDGGPFDEDGIANARIEDPSGPAIGVTAPPALAFTGATTLPIVVFGLLLITLGLILYAAFRRPDSSHI